MNKYKFVILSLVTCFVFSQVQGSDCTTKGCTQEKTIIDKAQKRISKLFSKKKLKKAASKLKENLTEERMAEITNEILASDLTSVQKLAALEALKQASREIDNIPEEMSRPPEEMNNEPEEGSSPEEDSSFEDISEGR